MKNLIQENEQLMKIYKDTNIPLDFIYFNGDKYTTLIDTFRNKDKIIDTYLNLKLNNIPLKIRNAILAYSVSNPNLSDDDLRQTILTFLKDLRKRKEKNVPADEEYIGDLTYKKEEWNQRWEYLKKISEKVQTKLQKLYNKFAELDLKENKKKLIEEIENSILLETEIYSVNISNDDKISPEYGIYIFNELKASSLVPYIQYIDDEEIDYYKVYNNSENRIIDDEIKVTKNVIYALFMEGKTHIKVKLDLISKKIYAEIPSNIKKNIFPDIENFFSVKLGKENVEFLKGTMEVPYPDYSEANFYSVTYLDEIFSQIIYVKELSNPRGIGNKNKFYFRVPSHIQSDTSVDHMLSFNIEPTVSGKIMIFFKSKLDKDNLVQFGNLINNIYLYEKDVKDENVVNVKELFDFFFKGEKEKIRTISIVKEKLDLLRAKNPEGMFMTRLYAKSFCECKSQPIIIDEKDKNDWKNLKIISPETNSLEEREVLLFPPKNAKQGPKNYYVCPSDTLPYPYLKETPENYNENYPILPCCKKTRDKKNLDYERIMKEGKSKKTSKSGYELKTLKPLSENNSGEIPESLGKFLSRAYNKDIKFKRYGVSDRHNSLIHCVLRACHGLKSRGPYDKDRLIRLTEKYYEDKKRIANKVRNLGKYINLECMSQELYDLDIEEIKNLLENDNTIFDSKLFYRGLEVLFQVNIFVFVTDQTQIGIPYLEQPRFKNFHIRSINTKLPSILILKHDSLSVNNLYELIVAEGVKEDKESFIEAGASLYGSEMTKYMKEFYENFSYDVIQKYKNRRITRKNPYNKIEWSYILKGHEILSQHLNNEGKAYAVDIKIEEKKCTLFIPPSQPFNSKVSTHVYYATKDLVEKYFSGKSKIGSEGIFYLFNDIDTVFIPCEDIDKEGDKCINYILEKNINKEFKELEELRINRRNAYIFTQLVIWCWKCGSDSLDNFFKNYVTIREPSEFTNITKIPYTMKECDNSKEAIVFLNEYWSVFTKEGKINMYDQLKENIKLFIINNERKNKGLDNSPVNYLKNILNTSEDFIKIPFNIIIIGRDNLKKWKEEGDSNIFVKTELEISRNFIYKDHRGKLYIMQSSNGNELIKALITANTWKLTGKNIGYNGISNDEIERNLEDYSYVIYKKDGENLKIIENNSKDDKDYLQLFEHTKGSYIAMLPV